MDKTTDKYLCIHGHFYQPPRENPWTDIIYAQKSASPYHDWNERVTRECYAPNTRSRLHGENGYISRLVNNFELISFNFGPTLLNWLEKHNPWVYAQIINADRLSIRRFGGHGNAIAQVYNHLIMPLASKRDKITQVKWGLADFYHRFGRNAEGMWLAETAVNRETLAVLADEGVRYTILSPYQAHIIKSFNSKTSDAGWQDVSGGKIDYTLPYRCFPTGDKNVYIDIFFYNGPLSKAIAYEKILSSGEVFLKRIMDVFSSESEGPSLVSMATDGESYGHHFKFGEMALTWVLDMINSSRDIKLTNYGEFLEKFPPEKEVEIIENSAWSCAHGVERWRSNCGCSVSQNPGWTQSWRTPLRNGLDWLNNHLSSIFEEKTKGLLKDCWKARDNYISLLLKPDENERKTFIINHRAKPLSAHETGLVFQLLESQQMALYMFTSCGWFFDDIAGIEAVQILMYAKKAIELCRYFSTEDLEKGLTGFLSEAMCNDPKYENGMEVYNKKVIPLAVDSLSTLANYAIACGIDRNRVPEWLKMLVKPAKEEKFCNEKITIYICEAASENLNPEETSGLIAIAVKDHSNRLMCLTGEINEYTYEMILKELKGFFPIKDGLDFIINSFQKYLTNTRVVTLKDLIPDIVTHVVQIFSEQIESGLYGTLINDNMDTVKNYLEAISITQQDIPSQFNDLFIFVFFDLISKLFRKSENLPLDLDEAENFLDFFSRKSEEITQEHHNITIRDNLIKQQRIHFLLEVYLTEQIEKIRDKNIILYLNNIINLINFINKYEFQLDWWKCQNAFNDLRTDMGFIKKLDRDSLALYRQAEGLMGFTGGI